MSRLYLALQCHSLSANVPDYLPANSLGIQCHYNEKTGVYSVKLMNGGSSKCDLLRKALAITPPSLSAQPFELPPSRKDLVSDKPDTPVLQMLWGIVTSNYFVPKGEVSEVFGWQIPDPLITEAIQQSFLLSQVSGMVAENTRRKPLKKCKCANLKPACYTQKAHNTSPVKKNQAALPSDKETFKLNPIPHQEVNDPDLESAPVGRSTRSGTQYQKTIPNCMKSSMILTPLIDNWTFFSTPDDDTSEKVIMNLHQRLIQKTEENRRINFLYDKPTKDDQENLKFEEESESTIH
ncbi:hypothetical protein Tco_1055251 [Tanacetum coccineum]|uniref:Uncharacterized protein n=1 Tax=Tanacetum coccineum TaxID=301880 RepID=A0ABQ5H082_9ASTR